MKRRSIVTQIFFIILSSAFFVNVSFAQPDESVLVEQKVTSLWNDYITLFSNGQSKLIAERIFSAPIYMVQEDEVQLLSTQDNVHTYFGMSAIYLASLNYKDTKTKQLNICVLNNASAIISAEIIRYRKDESVLTELSFTYLVAKKQEGWRFVASIPHNVNKMIKCAG